MLVLIQRGRAPIHYSEGKNCEGAGKFNILTYRCSPTAPLLVLHKQLDILWLTYLTRLPRSCVTKPTLPCTAQRDDYFLFVADIFDTFALQLRNEADTAMYSTEKSLGEYKDKLPQAVVDEITTAIGDCREAVKVRGGVEWKCGVPIC